MAISEANARWNRMALANVESAIPEARIRAGEKLEVHLLNAKSESLCGAGTALDFSHRDEYWGSLTTFTCKGCKEALEGLIRNAVPKQSKSMKIESPTESVGNLNSVGPLATSPTINRREP